MLLRPSACRSLKRRPPPEVYPSPLSVEDVSYSREQGRLTKRWVVEKAAVDPRLFHDPALNIDISSLPANADVPQAVVDDSTGPNTSAASRSVSVSALSYCHVTPGSHPADNGHRLVPVPLSVSLRGPPSGSSPICYSPMYRVPRMCDLSLSGLSLGRHGVSRMPRLVPRQDPSPPYSGMLVHLSCVSLMLSVS
jgi:hypothetical protein